MLLRNRPPILGEGVIICKRITLLFLCYVSVGFPCLICLRLMEVSKKCAACVVSLERCTKTKTNLGLKPGLVLELF